MRTIPNSLIDQAVAWRHCFHEIPEIGLQEYKTSDRLVQLLTEWGLDVESGIAKTGIVATLKNGEGPSIGLRADMDALPINEQNEFAHCSVHPGCMHACGHDGHMAIMLGAAYHLSRTRQFHGTVYFIFQPAEENAGGGRLMVEEGLFDRFPMDAIYALHNWPGLKAGEVMVNPGVMMASHDSFRITIKGKGCHAAMPELGHDPIIAASELIGALQTILSRRVASQNNAVLSVTQIHAGDAMNVIPEQAEIAGTLRCLQPAVRNQIITIMESFISHFLKPFGVEGELSWIYGYPATENDPDKAELLKQAAIAALGDSSVHWDQPASMAAEDFSFMLQVCPGAYCWLGAQRGDEPSISLHHPGYDFNDDIIANGIQIWVSLVEQSLVMSGQENS
ncbi:M20 aminoacylase family protein [Celerinatantimonas yamalensis]|uniref:M20 aminoacylase family protein n=1 Tax=Celerinatantimonas yamalensis TaxID=559956 RepID=A0ABW9G8Y4_9GAMM